MKLRKVLKENRLSRTWSRINHLKNLILKTFTMCIYEVSLTLMWDKKRGNPKYDERNKVLWIGPYIVKNKSEKGKYYLSSMDGRCNIPQPNQST
jgi:hypothetical protein